MLSEAAVYFYWTAVVHCVYRVCARTSLMVWYLEKSKLSVFLGSATRAADSISSCSSSSIICKPVPAFIFELNIKNENKCSKSNSAPFSSLDLRIQAVASYLQVFNHDGVLDFLGLQKNFDRLQAVKGNSDIHRSVHISHLPPEVQLTENTDIMQQIKSNQVSV